MFIRQEGFKMTLDQIKQAIARGDSVHWVNSAYDVTRDKIGQYLICCNHNESCIGLTWRDGVTLNGAEDEFYLGYKGE
jgi:hypothetical protein